MARVFIGVDPGNKGAFALINDKGDILSTTPMPRAGTKLDPFRIADLWRKIETWRAEGDHTIHVGMEKTFAYSEEYRTSEEPIKKIEGIVSMHNYGIGAGIIHGIIYYLRYPLILISPKTWQADLWIGADPRKKPKEKSLEIFKRLWPNDIEKVTFVRTERPDDGAIDAALIAEYTRRVSCTKIA